MTSCRPCQVIDCNAGDPYSLYSLQAEFFPFVMNCPPGYNCQSGGGYFITLKACDGAIVTRYIPPGSSQADYLAILADAQAELAGKQPFCNPDPFLDPCPTLYWNQPQTCCVSCPDGFPFCYTVPAGRFASCTLSDANASAYADACAKAQATRMCLSPGYLTCCAGVAFSSTIHISGGTGPFSWSIMGAMPAGTSAAFLGRNATITGTLAVSSVYTFTLVVIDQGSGAMVSKTFGIYAIAITPATIPDATLGVVYSQQLGVSAQPAGTTAAFAVSAGSLPTGITLTSSGLISGTPTAGLPASFTIGVTITP